MRSNDVTLKIVAADPAWQKRVFTNAVRSLDTPVPRKPEQMEQYTNSRRQAVDTLRFLGTADAAQEMARRMRGEDSEGLDYIYMLGLISSPERSAVRTALEEALADSDHPDQRHLPSMHYVRLSLIPAPLMRIGGENQQRVVEELLAALPNKRGKALSISLSTAVNEAWNANALPPQTTDKLVSQLVSMFDQLPLNDQNTLLSLPLGQDPESGNASDPQTVRSVLP